MSLLGTARTAGNVRVFARTVRRTRRLVADTNNFQNIFSIKIKFTAIYLFFAEARLRAVSLSEVVSAAPSLSSLNGAHW